MTNQGGYAASAWEEFDDYMTFQGYTDDQELNHRTAIEHCDTKAETEGWLVSAKALGSAMAQEDMGNGTEDYWYPRFIFIYAGADIFLCEDSYADGSTLIWEHHELPEQPPDDY